MPILYHVLYSSFQGDVSRSLRSDCRRSDPPRALRLLLGALLFMVASAALTGAAAGLPVLPADRVDTARPTFSHPTEITNPLFPVSRMGSAVQLGEDGGERTKFEVTLLPGTKTIDWNGSYEAVVSQLVVFKNGRIIEAALDYFAQADDGSVWYLGEDVSNFENGVVVNHEGTWRAGTDGPGGMIMPAEPKLGDVFNSENIPGLVSEVDTVTATGLTVQTPSGPVEGGIRIRELLMDGKQEDKVYAPGYGEVTAVDLDGSAHQELALAVPADASRGPAPTELAALFEGAGSIFEAAASPDWEAVSAALAAMQAAWDGYRADGVPELLGAQLSEALRSLSEGIGARSLAEVRQASIEVAQATLDMSLRHRPPAEIDLGRLREWAQQVLVDAESQDASGVAGDAATLEATWGRVSDTLAGPEARCVEEELVRLRDAAGRRNLVEAAGAASRLQSMVEELIDSEP